MRVVPWPCLGNPSPMPIESAVRLRAPVEVEAGSPPMLAVARPRLPGADALLPYLREIDDARWYSNFGPLLVAFERRLADRFRGDAKVVTGANATQLLTLALKAMDLPRGSLCIVPAWTFVASAHAVIEAGLTPWFLDVDADSWMLDPEAVAQAIRSAPGPVTAVMPVAAFGAMPDLAAWQAFRDATGVAVLIDGAAAFDACEDARLPVVVSLHATKVLGIGEGGYLASEDHDLIARVRQLTSFGFDGGREALRPATNAKISEYAAAVGQAALDAWPLSRLRWLRAAQLLRIALTSLPDVTFQPGWGAEWATSVCVVGLPDGMAGEVAESLKADGVDTRAWWGGGCHISPAFAACPRETQPVTDHLARSTIGLPFAIDLTAEDCGRIAAALQRAL